MCVLSLAVRFPIASACDDGSAELFGTYAFSGFRKP